MKKQSKIERQIEERIMKLPDNNQIKIDYLRRKKDAIHVCYYTKDGKLIGGWINNKKKQLL